MTHLRILLFVGALAGLGLTGCGGTSSAAQSASSTTTATGTNSAFTNCLAKHGAKLPSGGQPSGSFPSGSFPAGGGPGPGGQGGPPSGGSTPSFPGGDQSKLGSAIKACQKLAPAGFGRGGGAPNQQASSAYFSCLKDHGVTVPTTGGSSSGGTPPSFDPSDPAFQAAQQTCQSLLPAGGSGTATSTTTTPVNP